MVFMTWNKLGMIFEEFAVTYFFQIFGVTIMRSESFSILIK